MSDQTVEPKRVNITPDCKPHESNVYVDPRDKVHFRSAQHAVVIDFGQRHPFKKDVMPFAVCPGGTEVVRTVRDDAEPGHYEYTVTGLDCPPISPETPPEERMTPKMIVRSAS